MKAVLVVAIVLVVGFIIVAAWVTGASKKAMGFAESYNTNMRSMSHSDAYQQLWCPEFRQNVGLTQFTQFHDYYKSMTSDEVSFDTPGSQLDASTLYNKNVTGNGLFASIVYRTGKSDVGLVLKESNNTYCVISADVQPL